MTKKYNDNDDPRLEPKNEPQNHLAPRGTVGTSNQSQPTNADDPNQEKEVSEVEAMLQQNRERNLENKQGVRGERDGPFVAKRHFDRSR